MTKDKLNVINKLEEIEQKAINKYIDSIGLTTIMLETMEEEELKQYNEVYLEIFENCFYCGTNFDCKYCIEFQDEREETND